MRRVVTLRTSAPSLPGKGKTIFMIGDGYVGRVIMELAISAGYAVRVLSRCKESRIRIITTGASPIRADDETFPAVIHAECLTANIIISLTAIHVFGLGESPEDPLFDGSESTALIAQAIRHTDKPFIFASSTLLAAPQPSIFLTNEESPGVGTVSMAGTNPHFHLLEAPCKINWEKEQKFLGSMTRGVRAISLRVPPFVYGRGGGEIANYMKTAAELHYRDNITGAEDVVISAVHVNDLAKLFLLAADKGQPGDVFNANSDCLAQRALSNAIGTAVQVPPQDIAIFDLSVNPDRASFFTRALGTENRVSNMKATTQLEWRPMHEPVLNDVLHGSYKIALASGAITPHRPLWSAVEHWG